MGILGNLLKTAAVVGASAIPVIGPVAGPVVAGAVGASGGGGLKGAATAVAGNLAGGALKGGGTEGNPGGSAFTQAKEGVTPSSGGLFSGAAGGVPATGGDIFDPSTIVRNPLLQLASGEVMTGATNIPEMLEKLGLGQGGF
jgi:hypothetical protein